MFRKTRKGDGLTNYHIRKSIIISTVITLLVFGGAATVYAAKPDADQKLTDPEQSVILMQADGENVIPVKSKAYGSDVIREVAKKLTPKDSKFKRYSVDEKIRYVKLPLAALGADPDIPEDKDDAVDDLYELVKSGKSPITIKVTSVKKTVNKTPVKVKFKYSKKMYPFEFKVKSKGTKGTITKKYNVTSVNGKVVDKERTTRNVKNGKYRIVLTGKKNTPKNLTVKKYKSYKVKIEKKALKTYGDVTLGKNLVNYGMKFLGNPYKVGGKSLTHGIDCVQFVRALYKKYGITLPGNRNKLFHVGRTVSYSKARAGDIVFYGKHPAVYMGNGKVIRAGHKGIQISNIHYKKYTYIRRVK